MKTKSKSTMDFFLESMTPKQRRQYDKEYKEFVISEMLLATLEPDPVSVKKLAKMAGISPATVRSIRSKAKKNITVKAFHKLLNDFGYSLVITKGAERITIDALNFKKMKILGSE